MSRFIVNDLPISGLKLLQRESFGDERGSLSRLFCADELNNAGLNSSVVQVNYTKTKHKGTIRGLHYQNRPFCEIKLLTCLSGEIYDVAVDIRKGSPTYLKWHVEILTAENKKSLLLPEGVAHGFQTLTDDVDLLYCHSEYYNPDAERGLNPFDDLLQITWPLDVSEISDRDKKHPLLGSEFKGISL